MAYTAMSGVMSTASAVTAVATDPALPQVVGLVLKLKSLEKTSAGGGGAGVGLRNLVGPLQAYVKVQEKPWILPVGITVVVGVLFAAGYFTRKVQKK
jgi:uncharacterized membrane protein